MFHVSTPIYEITSNFEGNGGKKILTVMSPYQNGQLTTNHSPLFASSHTNLKLYFIDSYKPSNSTTSNSFPLGFEKKKKKNLTVDHESIQGQIPKIMNSIGNHVIFFY